MLLKRDDRGILGNIPDRGHADTGRWVVNEVWLIFQEIQAVPLTAEHVKVRDGVVIEVPIVQA